jgi:hypothetical protein
MLASYCLKTMLIAVSKQKKKTMLIAEVLMYLSV